MKMFLAAALAVLGWFAHTPLHAADDVPQLGRGINLGNLLEAPREGKWSGGRVLRDSDFAAIQKAGFQFVRVPICWSAHVGPGPDYTIDPQFVARIDWVVAEAKKYGLSAILDYHHDGELMNNPDAQGDRFVAMWKQVATHFKDAPPSIFFELLNEPQAKMDAAHWNALLARALAAVRETNPTRAVVVGPIGYNSPKKLADLVLPDNDRHLLVTIHYYDPFTFTHQGANWVHMDMKKFLGNTWTGTDNEKKAVTDAFNAAAQWGAVHQRPLFLGEFGAYDKGPLDSRARWTAFVARTAETHQMAWSYWEYNSGFGAYDPIAQQWREPLLQALVPPALIQ